MRSAYGGHTLRLSPMSHALVPTQSPSLSAGGTFDLLLATEGGKEDGLSFLS